VSVLFVVGLSITVSMVIFVATATHGLSQYDPMMRFEEAASAAIDTWLTEPQSLILLAIAKFGSALSVVAGLLTAVIFLFVKRQLYTLLCCSHWPAGKP